MLVFGIAGVLCQGVLLPVCSWYKMGSHWMLLIGLVGELIFLGIIAFVSNPTAVTALTPLEGLSDFASVAVQSMISGVTVAASPKDQGTLLGVLNGLQLLASCVGHFILTPFNT